MRTPITRRTALRSLAGAAALASLSRSRAADAPKSAPAMPTPPANTVPINHSVCNWCHPKTPLEARAKAAKDIALASIELLTREDFPTLKKYPLSCGMRSFPPGKPPRGVPVGGIPKAFNRLEHHDTL